MRELAVILVSTALVNNFVLVNYLGLCPFLGAARKLEGAIGMAFATTFVLTLSSVASYLINEYLLVPFGLPYLRTLAFIVAVAAVVQFAELLVQRNSPLLHQVLGVYLPLITTNCAILGVALLNAQASRGFLQALVFGLGTAAGFSLVLVLFSAIRQRIAVADVPEAFKGSAIALITAGLMSLAFMGFSGLVK